MTPEPPRAGARALGFGFDQLVRRGLRGIWVRGELPTTAAVWAANHHSWWDGFVANAVLLQQKRRPALIMDGENLSQYRFLASSGVIPASRPRQALAALRDGRVLIVFPEAELRAPGSLGSVAGGAEWFARQAPAALVPVAVRLTMRGHQHPEAYVDIGAEVLPGQLESALSGAVDKLDCLLRQADPRAPVPGFEQVATGRRSWDERISRWSSRLSR